MSFTWNAAVSDSLCSSDLVRVVTSVQTRTWEEHGVPKLRRCPSGNEKQDQEISGSNLGAEPFDTSSSSCLNGQISGVSKYQVASGGYPDVWTGLWGRKKVAIKVARGFSSGGLRIERSELLKRIGNEYLIWSNLRHENVLECPYDFGGPAEHRVPAQFSHISKPIQMPIGWDWLDSAIVSYALLIEIAKSLCYLHVWKPGVEHGDIRAGNASVSDTGIPKLNDLGLLQ
ncbi:hypothetical protein BU17DRAFT_66794 [Hysterangium stoloniferum]|nr:hypothetical protein BU17DRAFT_66794 [Hysterangium stoloniferum]